jgi:hypothetical protein
MVILGLRVGFPPTTLHLKVAGEWVMLGVGVTLMLPETTIDAPAVSFPEAEMAKLPQSFPCGVP